MGLHFFKYQGTGNDFVIVDNRTTNYSLSTKQIKLICDRHFGIGADGFMFLEKDIDNDFKMRYFNSDGNEASMCGNGGRCIVSFARHLGIIKDQATFSAIDGVHVAKISESNISLKMNDVDEIGFKKGFYFLDTGSPHLIIFDNDIDTIDIFRKGKELRYDDDFKPDGTNINFVQQLKDGIYVRTYERGVENETLSCGTGVTASAIAFAIQSESYLKTIGIKTLGGDLEVSFTREEDMRFTDIWLTGPAQLVFEGDIQL